MLPGHGHVYVCTSANEYYVVVTRARFILCLSPFYFVFNNCVISLIMCLSVGLTGTKLGCGGGGCGACTVMVSRYDRTRKKIQYPFESRPHICVYL